MELPFAYNRETPPSHIITSAENKLKMVAVSPRPQFCTLFFYRARCIVAEAPPVAEEARRGWRSGQNRSALQAEKAILGTARVLRKVSGTSESNFMWVQVPSSAPELS